MEGLIITFELVDLDGEAFREYAESIAPKFTHIPGLVSKVWLEDPEANTYGGAYFFQSRAALEAYRASDIVSGLAAHPNLANVTIRAFGTLEEATAITAGPLATALAAAWPQAQSDRKDSPMNPSHLTSLARVLAEGPTVRRGFLQGLASLAMAGGIVPLVLDADAKKRKRKRKGKKRRKKGNGGGNDGGGGGGRCNQTICGNQCVDLDTDRNNCGACRAACPDGAPCVGGLCVTAFGSAGSALGQYRNPGGIAFNDAFGFVADTANGRMVRIVDGVANQAFALPEFVGPVAVAASPDSHVIHVVDKDAQRVFVLTEDGVSLGAFGSSLESEGGFSIPAGIAVSRANGDIFVADFRRDRIAHFTAFGALQRIIGGGGSGDGEFNQPFGMAFDAAGNLHVADAGNHRVQVLDGAGNFVRAFGRQGSGLGELDRPAAIAINRDGDLFVVDQGNNRIQQFTPDGEVIRAFGSAGSGLGQFDRPTGIAILEDGTVAVVDTFNDRLQLFTPAGEASENVLPGRLAARPAAASGRKNQSATSRAWR